MVFFITVYFKDMLPSFSFARRLWLSK